MLPCGLGLAEHIKVSEGDLVMAEPAFFLLHANTVQSPGDCTFLILLLVVQHILAEVTLSQSLAFFMVQELCSTEWTLTVLLFYQSLNDVRSETLSPSLFFLVSEAHDVLCSK